MQSLEILFIYMKSKFFKIPVFYIYQLMISECLFFLLKSQFSTPSDFALQSRHSILIGRDIQVLCIVVTYQQINNKFPQQDKYLMGWAPQLNTQQQINSTETTPTSVTNLKQMPQNSQRYCYWDIRSPADSTISIINLCLALLIFLNIIVTYWRSKKVLHKGFIFYIYYILVAWYFAYTIQYLFAIIVFNTSAPNQLFMYAVFQIMDFFPAFLLMTCLYYSAYNLLKRIHTICDERGHQITTKQLKFYTFLKKYQFIRLIYVTPTLMLLFFQQKQQNLIICSQLQLSLFLVDSIVCNICLLISLRTFRHKSTQLQLLTEQERKRLVKQSVLLQLAGIIRFGMGLIFIVFSNFDFVHFGACPQFSLERTVVYMAFGQIVMHFLPIFVVLSIFRISSDEFKQLRDSDLDTHFVSS